MGARYVIGDWRAVKGALAGGATIRGAAESTGVGRGAVYLWSRRDRPPREVIMSEVPRSAEVTAAAAACGGREPGARLTPWDRALIHAMLLAGVSVNIFFTISTNIFSPIAPPLFRRPRQRGCAASG